MCIGELRGSIADEVKGPDFTDVRRQKHVCKQQLVLGYGREVCSAPRPGVSFPGTRFMLVEQQPGCRRPRTL